MLACKGELHYLLLLKLTSEKRETRRPGKLEKSHPEWMLSISHRGEGRLRYIVFRALSLDDLLCDDVSRGEKEGRSRALCRKWPREEQLTGKRGLLVLVEAR